MPTNIDNFTIIIFICSASLWIGWWYFMCTAGRILDTKVPFGDGFNPPSITFSVFAIFTLFLAFGGFTVLSYSGIGRIIIKCLGFIGQHTLYIFLYHSLWLEYFLPRYVHFKNKYIKILVYFGVMIVASIILDLIFQYLRQIIYCVCDKLTSDK